MSLLLSAKDIRVEFPAKKVLEGVTLGIGTGDRIGIVGKNGDGKSTLLSVLAGLLTPDQGEVIRSGCPTIGFLGQADTLGKSGSVGRAIVGDVPTYTWAADRTTRGIIDALVGDIPWEKDVSMLSGGQRRRADLARLLIQDWDILMLDEPTNHLDMRAIAWLANHLQGRWQKNAGALLVVTHDRWFLDEVALNMWEVHDGKVEPFEGGFSAYVQQRVERDRLTALVEEKRRNLMRKELAWLSRGARARSTKPKFHLKAARELIANDPPLRDTLELKRAAMSRLGKQVYELVDVSIRFSPEGDSRGKDVNKPILDRIDWLIGPGERIGILGANGAGKTTLLRLLEGSVTPTSGSVNTGKTVKAAIVSQRLEELEEVAGDRVREVLGRHPTRLMVEGKSMTSAQLLERLGFEREHLQSLVGSLSGGQKRRLQLLLALCDQPNVLILDEPGNDMDTDMLAAMEDLLDSWPGTLLLVSHDRYLMERVTDDQFALMEGKLRHVPGGIDEFLRISAESESHPQERPENSPPGSLSPSPLPQTPLPSLTGGEAFQIKKQLAALERKLDSLKKQASATTAQMHEADPTDFVGLGILEQALQDTRAQIGTLEDTWLELSEKLEQG
ncbi:MAG: ABC-F family ATP-binding cassette domain-containing protein [Coriobacteriaceae bacterium]|nr:ABC-F family ATP-binding cassette domain-containing protein [Coriobacteriaceae bacterium]